MDAPLNKNLASVLGKQTFLCYTFLMSKLKGMRKRLLEDVYDIAVEAIETGGQISGVELSALAEIAERVGTFLGRGYAPPVIHIEKVSAPAE